ncbi:hypothetical protein LCGC14_2161270, partial [marine sediment metagenome]
MVTGLSKSLRTIPIALGFPCDRRIDFWHQMYSGWLASKVGEVGLAKEYLSYADSMLAEGRLNPDLSVLRHNIGIGEGSIESMEATEDEIISLFLPQYTEETTGKYLIGDISEENIRSVIYGLEPGHHKDNIKTPRPHIMVMSTGRCGTMALHKLFRGSNLNSYHTYWFMTSAYSQWEMACRLYSGNHESLYSPAEWAATRAAEWLGENPMIGLNHMDTIFAPVFAAIHEKSKFVYLRRDPEKVFNSFYKKDQYKDGSNCFRPVLYDFDPDYQFSLPDITEEEGINYHITETEKFCRTFGKVMGDRWIEISADKLFAQDRDEISMLLEFTGSDIPLDNAVEHFKT